MPITIYGLKELRAELKTVSVRAPREFNAALREGAKTVTARAVQLAPKGQTGALAGSGKPYVTARAAGVRFSSPIATVHEFATTWHRRTPSSGLQGSGRGGLLTASQKMSILRSGGQGLETVHYTKGGAPPRFAYRSVAELGPGLIDDTWERILAVLRANGWFR